MKAGLTVHPVSGVQYLKWGEAFHSLLLLDSSRATSLLPDTTHTTLEKSRWRHLLLVQGLWRLRSLCSDSLLWIFANLFPLCCLSLLDILTLLTQAWHKVKKALQSSVMFPHVYYLCILFQWPAWQHEEGGLWWCPGWAVAELATGYHPIGIRPLWLLGNLAPTQPQLTAPPFSSHLVYHL
jgi:hypothetical protein